MIWLVGREGMLGTELADALTSRGLPWVGTDRDVSITDPEALRSFAGGRTFDWIVNCAAYTAVDKAESEPALAAALNADGPGNLAETANACGACLLHLSTDYVFPGDAMRPYREEDPLGPRCVYGRTKAEGEAIVRRQAERSVIVRTAWLYGQHGPNFVYTMLRLMREKKEVGVVADQVGSPTWSADLASAIVRILGAKEPRLGTYHFAGEGATSWYDFAVEILHQGLKTGILDQECAVNRLTTAQYPTAAHRPAYSVLSAGKIVRDYGVIVPNWRESVRLFLAQIADVFIEDHRKDPAVDWDRWLAARCRPHAA